MIVGAGEIQGRLHFRHGHQLPVEAKTPPVVTAHYTAAFEPTRVFYQNFAPVGTNIGEALQLFRIVAEQQQRLIQKMVHKPVRKGIFGAFYRLFSPDDHLPRARKNAFPRLFKNIGVVVKGAG
jgi:hypothetical protein